jgi:hypothetical protein
MDTHLQRRAFLATAGAATLAGGLAASDAFAQVRSAPSAQTQTPPKAPAAYPAPSGEHALKIANLNDLEAEAEKVIPKGAFAYISAGSDNQWTLRENRLAFDRRVLLPQYLVGKPAPDLKTILLGHTPACRSSPPRWARMALPMFRPNWAPRKAPAKPVR